MKTYSRANRFPSRQILCLFLALSFCLFLFMFCKENPNEGVFGNSVQTLEGWSVSVNGLPEEQSISLPASVSASGKDYVVLRRKLPRAMTELSICFESSDRAVRVSAGDEQVYEFGYAAKPLFGKSPGNTWVMARLPDYAQDEVLTIELVAPYNETSTRLPQVYLGTQSDLIQFFLKKWMPLLLACSLIIIMGMIGMILYFLVKRFRHNEAILYASVFSVLYALWFVGRSGALQVMAGNAFTVTMISHLLFTLLPVPGMLFLKKYQPFQTRLFDVLTWLMFANFVVVNVLAVAGVCGYCQCEVSTLTLIAVALAYGIVCAVATLIREFRTGRRHAASNEAFIVLMVLMLAEVVHYGVTRSFHQGSLICYALLVSMLVFIAWSYRRSLLVLPLKTEVQAFKQLAYTDILTGLGNRTAFEKRMAYYRSHDARCEHLAMVLCDVNDLKLVNDTFGHSCGDKVIAAVGIVIRKEFTNIGTCYRIGGDEYCILCRTDNVQVMEDTLDSMAQHIESLSDEFHVPISIAYGYSRYASQQVPTVDNVFAEADSKMYARKKAMKAG